MESIANRFNDEKLVEEGYLRVKAELDALDAKNLEHVNLDVTAAVTTMLGVIPRVQALRAQIATDLPKFDLAALDKLEDYTYALHYAQAGYVAATRPPDGLDALVGEAARVRDRLEQDALALVGHGLVDSVPIAQVKGGTSYRGIAIDLEVLSRVLKASWDSIQGKSAVTQEHLSTASKLSLALMRVVGLREQAPALVAAAMETRNRAFTQFIRAYEATRRAIGFLRQSEGDADSIAPSLYPGRPRRRAAAATVVQAPAASDPEPEEPVASHTPASLAPNVAIGKNGPFV
jgi:hypothetical protein